MKTFDLISDIHLDFWVSVQKRNKNMDAFIHSLLPENPSDVLVIAGDLGHYNDQNALFLSELKSFYNVILFTPGNHDYYLVSGEIRKKYKNNSFNRWSEMKRLASEIDGVFVLEGETFSYGSVTFGGTGMWYDFSYGEKVLGLSQKAIQNAWHAFSNDSRLISGNPVRTFEFFQQEKERFEAILTESDVLFTHVSGDWSEITPVYQKDLNTSFYYFDGSAYKEQIKGKIWCAGHTHVRSDYTANGCRFINASLGYPDECEGVARKIETIHIQR